MSNPIAGTAQGMAISGGSASAILTNCTLSDVLLDGTGTTPLENSTVTAYLASSQPQPPLASPAGVAFSPVGQPVATALADDAGNYTLTGLLSGTPYHLYVVPGDTLYTPFWLYWRLADAPAAVAPCVLYGTLLDATGAPVEGAVQAWNEDNAAGPGNQLISATLPLTAYTDAAGNWTLPLLPSALLSPAVLYRVQVGLALYRGTIPQQNTISLAAWAMLPTTTRLA